MSDITPTFCGLAAEEILQLKQEKAELAAQVELLQDFLAQAKKFNPEIAIPDFLMKTGQCLAEHNREVAARAGKAGFLVGLDARRSIEYEVHNGDWAAADRAADEYANKIKSGEVEL